VEGNPTRLIGYAGGVAAYVAACDQVRDEGYAGFSIY